MNNHQSNQTKRKIIIAAINLFATKGFDATSTRDIAGFANVNLGLISYYFKTKENIYSTIIESIIDFGLQYLHEELILAKDKNYVHSISKNQQIELFCRLLHKYIDFIYSENVPKNFIVLMIKEQTISKSKFGEMYRSKIHVVYDSLRYLLAQIMGLKRPNPTVILEISGIFGQILSFKLLDNTTLTALNRKDYTDEENEQIKLLLYTQIENTLTRLNVR